MNNSSSNCSFDDVNAQVRVVQQVFHFPTLILGSVLNLLAIRHFSIFLRKRWRGYASTSIYMINLAVFDLLLVLSLLFKIVLLYVKASLPALCTLAESLYFVSMYGSIFTICFISLDRFLAIRYPLVVNPIRSPKKIFMICCVIWALVWAGSTPVYSFHGETEDYRCFHNMSDQTWSSAIFFPLEVFGFLIPLAIIGFCSCRSICILLGREHYTADWIQQKACVWTIAASLLVFVLSFLPVHVGFFLQFLVRNGFISDCQTQRNIILFLHFSLCFSNVNCCLDVFCYYFVIKEFRTDLLAHRPSRAELVLQDTMTTRG
ncbi:PREDICTED: G-protein coupled receptor 55 [Elephantulus edwardii]|uniref:G-protein coupled receptor 55 n=1 Tax=Elephantulus edwardii TaxID=28737 RepID=UPI0003F0857D|nr:PREDICTED: G-protein coupled receptor 55 [Elephantulus edwardii]